MKVLPVVMVLTKSLRIVDYYEGENIRYRFRVIRFWEMDAREVIEGGYVCLAPLTVLMKDGKELHEKADRLIVEPKLGGKTKGTIIYLKIQIVPQILFPFHLKSHIRKEGKEMDKTKEKSCGIQVSVALEPMRGQGTIAEVAQTCALHPNQTTIRYVPSRKLSNSLNSLLYQEVLNQAPLMGKPGIFNSDQGWQYTTKDFASLLLSHNMLISVDEIGRVFDKIFIERL